MYTIDHCAYLTSSNMSCRNLCPNVITVRVLLSSMDFGNFQNMHYLLEEGQCICTKACMQRTASGVSLFLLHCLRLFLLTACHTG